MFLAASSNTKSTNPFGGPAKVLVYGIIVFLLGSRAFGQCAALSLIGDSINFEGVNIIYYQHNDQVRIKYAYQGFELNLGDSLAFDCNTRYNPSIPKATWRNDYYIGFTSGCGSSCFANHLLPLQSGLNFQEAGQLLIDTTKTIYVSIYKTIDKLLPYVEVKNHLSQKSQTFNLDSGSFPVAIPLEYLDYSEAHPKGFKYENSTLTLFLRDGQKLNFDIEL